MFPLQIVLVTALAFSLLVLAGAVFNARVSRHDWTTHNHMRTITDHKVNGLNDAINIYATDSTPTEGGACATYRIEPVTTAEPAGPINPVTLIFQNKPMLSSADVIGISNEALIAVVIDRMRGFQGGKFACYENAEALVRLEESLMWLQKRTRDRMARGVEGTYQK